MTVRKIDEELSHTSLGSSSTGTSDRSKKRKIKQLTFYPDQGKWSRTLAIQTIAEGQYTVLRLMPFAATELLKFLLEEVPGISVAADEEIEHLIKAFQARIEAEHEDARQAVKCVQGQWEKKDAAEAPTGSEPR